MRKFCQLICYQKNLETKAPAERKNQGREHVIGVHLHIVVFYQGFPYLFGTGVVR